MRGLSASVLSVLAGFFLLASIAGFFALLFSLYYYFFGPPDLGGASDPFARLAAKERFWGVFSVGLLVFEAFAILAAAGLWRLANTVWPDKHFAG